MIDAPVFIVADDHPLFRHALRHTIEAVVPGARVIEAGNLDEVLSAIETAGEVDLIFFDLKMPGSRGFSGLMYLRAEYPAHPVCVVSATEDAATIRNALALGASGFIPKSASTDCICAAIAEILAGGEWLPPGLAPTDEPDPQTALMRRLKSLTPQQVRVLMMMSEGLLNKQIAFELGVSEATVKAHVSAILQKLEVENRTQAVLAAGRIETGQWQAAAK